jgi:FKBP-type peptidyl-prolyl cis-trans isomerase 2
MKFYPNVSIVDTALSKVVGEVTYLSENALTVTFSHSFAGKAYLS